MTTQRPLDGRTAIVTGASSGIGRATATALARDGAAVVLAARRAEKLNELATELREEYDAETLVVPTDVRDHEAVEAVVDAAVDEFGSLDVLVNNAGVLRSALRLESMPIEEYKLMMETNVDGMFYATRAALPHLRASNGNLVFIGSDSGKHPDPLIAVYASTKWWTRGFALSIEAREGRNGVGVTVVNPGDARTEIEFHGERMVDVYEEDEILEADEIAEAVAFAVRQKETSTISELDVYGRDLSTDVYRGLLEEELPEN